MVGPVMPAFGETLLGKVGVHDQIIMIHEELGQVGSLNR